jgi:ankyrin repeat protein
VSTVPLPNDANLEQLRKRAKELRDLARAGDADAVALVAEHHPNGGHAVSLSGAQLVLARHHGFASWARLKRHLEVMERYGRAPDEVAVSTDVADEFLRLACLHYGESDGRARWQAARALVGAARAIAARNIHVAAALADVDATRSLLAEDASRARREGGPYRWEPLLYLTYARHDPDIDEDAVLTTAQLLLDHGAPNAGFLWHGTYAFTALTGVIGGGELGPLDQPAHPNVEALAELLLAAGADPNDGQALYNRMFEEDDGHLRLLLAHGLGRGDGGPWRARLAEIAEHAWVLSPPELLRRQLEWAVVHDQAARVRLLVEHGVDILTPFDDSGTPAEAAARNGNVEIVEHLVANGARRPALEGVDALIGAALAGDRVGVDRWQASAEEATTARPGLLAWAARFARPEAIRLLVELGWDVNRLGRSDAPVEQPWNTALHEAAGNGDVELVRLLLSLGADPNVQDARFNSTPLGWARHFEHAAVVELLGPLTDEGS